MQHFSKFLRGRLKGCVYATKGAYLLIKTEPSIQVQITIGILMTLIGICVQLTTIEWMFQTVAIGMVLGMEGVNTSIEAIADFIHPDFHHKIGLIKDLAAGAVFITAITAIIIGCFIYIPYILELI